jgi:hypothetical protein
VKPHVHYPIVELAAALTLLILRLALHPVPPWQDVATFICLYWILHVRFGTRPWWPRLRILGMIYLLAFYAAGQWSFTAVTLGLRSP